MKYILAFLTFAFFGFNSASAFELPKKIGEHVFGVELTGFEIREDSLTSKGTSIVIGGNFNYQIDDSLKLKLSPVASFVSGQQTSRDPQAPLSNSIYLKEASAILSPTENLQLMAGSLRQKEFLPGLVGYHRSFPAAGLFYNYNISEKAYFTLNGQYAVPTSSGLATSQSDFSSTSSLLSGALALHLNFLESNKAMLSVAHFKFKNLSSQAANDSLARGNTVISPSANTYYFANQYEGSEVTLTNKTTFNEQFNFDVGLSFVENSKVAKSSARGYLISGSPGYFLNSKDLIRFKYELYRVHTDAFVAVFADPTRGRPNRKGERFSLSLQRMNYEIEVIYSYSKVLKQSPFQNNDRALFLNLFIERLAVF